MFLSHFTQFQAKFLKFSATRPVLELPSGAPAFGDADPSTFRQQIPDASVRHADEAAGEGEIQDARRRSTITAGTYAWSDAEPTLSHQ